MPRFVSFYRNVYNRRPGNPTSPEFVDAYLGTGATAAFSFLANGTIVFDAKSLEDAISIDAQARVQLERQCGLKEISIIRSLNFLIEMQQSNPFASVKEDVHECIVCFLESDALTADHLPLISKRNDVNVFGKFGQDALAYTYMIDGKSGYPTKLIESKMKIQGTSRNWRTVQRLIEKFG